ncbi:MAG: response regulator transcription factor [Bacillota bacterium]|nr:MAG: DNA-binding response regulator [Bacillota bacterium]
MPQRILVVDDEPAIVELVAYNLRREGFDVLTAATGPEALEKATAEKPDLVVLDLMLPGMDGFAVCRELRKRSEVPVLILSARGDEVDRVVGFELGADDYVVKPFSPRELIARVKAILRRTAPAEASGGRRVFGDLTIDYETYEVTVGGRRVDLTPTEFQILRVLTSRPGRVFSRDELLDRVRGEEFFGDVRTVDVHVRHLRAKIGDDPQNPRYIETVRGVGYRFKGGQGR